MVEIRSLVMSLIYQDFDKLCNKKCGKFMGSDIEYDFYFGGKLWIISR